jgi:hypothetical protein
MEGWKQCHTINKYTSVRVRDIDFFFIHWSATRVGLIVPGMCEGHVKRCQTKF